MRAWTLCGAALSASIVAAVSFILILIVFLSLYTGQLPIQSQQRSLMQGIQIMVYLLPFLIVWAWCCYLVIFALFRVPTHVWSFGQIIKVLLGLWIAWFTLLLIVIAIDFSWGSWILMLKLASVSYLFFVIPIVCGLVCGNIFYLKIQEQQQRTRVLWQKSIWSNEADHR